MSIGASPPQLPPQISPDGKWIWDGRAWQAVPPPAPGEFVEIPAIPGLSASVRPTAVAVEEVSVPYAPPVLEYPMPAPLVLQQTPAVTPLWRQYGPSRMTMPLYVIAAAVVLVMAMIALNSMSVIQLPWSGASSSASGPSPTPSAQPLANRSDFERAGHFLNVVLPPSLVAFTDSLTPLGESCNGTLSNSCFSAITATDQAVKNILSVIDHSDIPLCIAPTMAKFRGDVVEFDAGLQTALAGFKDQRTSEMLGGMHRFTAAGSSYNTDGAAVDRAHKTQCETQESGP